MISVVIYLFNIILNLVLCRYGNLFYDNATYIAYQQNHLPLVFLWGFTTVYGLYVYSDKIWKQSDYPYIKWMHKICCVLLLISPLIPYSSTETWTNDFHVWIIVAALCMFYYQWISFFHTQQKRTSLQRWFLFHTCINIAILFFLGHVTLFNEIYFSLSMNILLRENPKNRLLNKNKTS